MRPRASPPINPRRRARITFEQQAHAHAHDPQTSTTQTSTTPSGGSGSGSGGGGSSGSGATGSGSGSSGSTGADPRRGNDAHLASRPHPTRPGRPRTGARPRRPPASPDSSPATHLRRRADPESASPLVHAVAARATPATAPALHPPARPVAVADHRRRARPCGAARRPRVARVAARRAPAAAAPTAPELRGRDTIAVVPVTFRPQHPRRRPGDLPRRERAPGAGAHPRAGRARARHLRARQLRGRAARTAPAPASDALARAPSRPAAALLTGDRSGAPAAVAAFARSPAMAAR